MPEIQDLYPPGDVGADYQFVVACDSTIDLTVATGRLMNFKFTGPYARQDVMPAVVLNVTDDPQCAVTDAKRKEVTCTVSGQTLASGFYHGALRTLSPGYRANLATWRILIRPNQTDVL